MSLPRVSVIIPTYNRATVIGATLKSVLAQTEGDIEVIVVDDGSTDNTRQLIANWGDSRVSCIGKANGGPASARNAGIGVAKGEFVAFLDSDDQWPANYLERMLEPLAGSAEYGLSYSPITLVHADGRHVVSYKRPEGRSGWLARDLFRNSFIWPSAAVMRRSVLDGFYFDENLRRVSEDSDFFLRLSLKTKYAFVGSVESLHFVSGDSISVKDGVTFARHLVLERFYYRLGGEKAVPATMARKRLSHSCKRLADDFAARGCRAAAVAMYAQARSLWPWDHRPYMGLMKAKLMAGGRDAEPNWQRPAPLGEPLCSAGSARQM
jgi:glycosyltransferase involved in cell wall biosynthesis